jgi:NDP-4-keto-2,6-dideoxyhexose 3-C-methyltransferase
MAHIENEVKSCRVCGNTNLIPVLNLGHQVLTGVFPKDKTQPITSGPLELVKCDESTPGKTCGLLQLRHSFEPEEMYGAGYGYQSGINQTMTKHLQSIVADNLQIASVQAGDIVLDIGANDGTLLKAYPHAGLSLLGIDPSAEKFRKFYPDHIKLVADFFTADNFRNVHGNKKAKIITSIAMFYDLESPLNFMRDIHSVLDENGIWVFEQSYLPTMIEMNAYDTVCHEHLEYYGLRQIQWMTQKIGFRILKVELNFINGGSFRIVVTPNNSKLQTTAENRY